MDKEVLKNLLTDNFAGATVEDGGQWLNLLVPLTDWLAVADRLRNDKEFGYNYLFCLTCVDWKTKLQMVYHLSNTSTRDTVVVKIDLDTKKPEVESVSHIWRTAEFHEREVYEMFGVNFLNHHDLRLLILPDGWEGRNPLRKDFEDPVNMIKL